MAYRSNQASSSLRPPDFDEAVGASGSVADSAAGSCTSEGSASRPRKWDDPPEKPPPLGGPITTMVLVKEKTFGTCKGCEVEQIGFTREDLHIACKVTGVANNTTQSTGYISSVMLLYEVKNVQRKMIKPVPSRGIRVKGDFAISGGLGTASLACAFRRGGEVRDGNSSGVFSWQPPSAEGPPRLEVYDLQTERRRVKADFQVEAPLAFTPDGSHVAGISLRNPSRIVIVDVRNTFKLAISRQLAVHTAAITHMAVTPDGTGLASASEDGSIRMTSLQTGRTLRKAEVESRAKASMLRISEDGDLVASVWGRQVYLWRLKTDQMSVCNLDSVRQSEGWPLAISPDCQHLASRTEDGIDVVDLETGLLRADFPFDAGRALVTSAAFSYDGRWLAIGDSEGWVTVLEIITASA
ncbi:hypothetical protein OQA88_4539 [Cercophora sp. LCS_1]